MLSEIKEQFGVPVLSDIHTPEMAHAAAEILDVIQVPAFLARQTDFYLEAAKTKAVLNIKKGQFMSPYEMQNALDKFSSGGGKEAWITERGTFFGYGNLVVDFRSIKIIREMGVPYIYDATHSLQLPAARGSVSGGQREFIPSLARAQVAAGADGLFVETHPAVEQALCDRENQWPLEKMKELIEPILDIWNVIKSK
jgi:2-dehydro-3-deoxyphosphooctonate aldolase (KDO 8-P synthase)